MAPPSSKDSDPQVLKPKKTHSHSSVDEKIMEEGSSLDPAEKPGDQTGPRNEQTESEKPSSELQWCNHEEAEQEGNSPMGAVTRTTGGPDMATAEVNGRDRLKRHRNEVAGRVWIPDIWGQEELLKDWIDCTAFDNSLVSSSVMLARAALAEEGRIRANSSRLRIENRC
ncbi:hypothetical protein NMG60_11008450 [Bertholletia excelsa]